jgi:hypothetical protein
VTSLGVEAITGKPYKPTTQGKNERFHQTLFRWLDKQPFARSHAELQAQVDQIDLIYNTERPHQGLPGHITPLQSWGATAIAEAPRPKPVPVLPEPQGPDPVFPLVGVAEAAPDPAGDAAGSTSMNQQPEGPPEAAPSAVTGSIAHPTTTGSQKLRVYPNGVVNIGRTLFSLTKAMGGRIDIADWDAEGIVFVSTEGEIIVEYFWPPEGTAYLGIGKARARFRK